MEEINNNQITLLVYNSITNKYVLDLCKDLSEKYKGLGVVVASNTAENMLDKLNKNGVDSSKIFFVDCISKNKKNSKNIASIQGPESLTELSIAISILFKQKNIDVVLIDSVSSLLVHNKDISLVRFIHNLVNRIRSTDKKLVLTIMSKDKKGSLSSVPLFVDAVVENS